MNIKYLLYLILSVDTSKKLIMLNKCAKIVFESISEKA